MNITLTQNEYNSVFQLLSAITGKNAVVANKLMDQIRGKVDEGKAKEIELDVENYELESILKGIKALAENEKSTVNDLAFFAYVAKTLKIGKALDKELATLIDTNASVEIDSTVELD